MTRDVEAIRLRTVRIGSSGQAVRNVSSDRLLRSDCYNLQLMSSRLITTRINYSGQIVTLSPISIDHKFIRFIIISRWNISSTQNFFIISYAQIGSLRLLHTCWHKSVLFAFFDKMWNSFRWTLKISCPRALLFFSKSLYFQIIFLSLTFAAECKWCFQLCFFPVHVFGFTYLLLV